MELFITICTKGYKPANPEFYGGPPKTTPSPIGFSSLLKPPGEKKGSKEKNIDK